jgi:hypothetical protein
MRAEVMICAYGHGEAIIFNPERVALSRGCGLEMDA